MTLIWRKGTAAVILINNPFYRGESPIRTVPLRPSSNTKIKNAEDIPLILSKKTSIRKMIILGQKNHDIFWFKR